MPTIVFDLDGTLVDSAPDIHAAVARALAEEGSEALPLATVTRFIGNGVPKLVERVLRARCEPPDADRHAEFLARFMRHYEAAPAERTQPYPGVAPALAGLVAAGHRCAVCTNKPARAAAEILDRLGLARHVAALVGGDSLPVRKPDPAPLRAAIEAAGGDPAIYVGDTEIDAETAAAAAVPFLLFTEGYRRGPAEAIGCAATFRDFARLPGLVEDALARSG